MNKRLWIILLLVVAMLVPMAFVTTWWLAALALITWGVFYMLVVINTVTYRQQVTPEP